MPQPRNGRRAYTPEPAKASADSDKRERKNEKIVMEVNPTSHTPAHNVTAAAAPFRA